MDNKDIQKFIDKNKDSIEVIKDFSGTIIGIKVINKEKLDFTDTNCKLSKDWARDVIVTNDGEKYDVSYPTKKEVATAWAGRTFKQIRNFKFSDIPGLAERVVTRIDNVITPYTDRLMGVYQPPIVQDPPKPTVTPKAVATATGPVADFNTQKAKADGLLTKLEEILKKYEENKKYKNDPEIIAFRTRLNEIKERYKNAINRNDAPEMLNVKTKLVSLSGRIIAKQNALEKEKPKRKPKKKNTKPKPITKDTSNGAKKTPDATLKAARTRFINKYNKEMGEFNKAIEGYKKSIELYNSKITIYKNEIALLENNIANIDQIAEDNNFDSREKEVYLKDQKEKIADMQEKIKEIEKQVGEIEEQIKQEEEKKKAYDEEYVEVKFKNEFEPEGYIKKKEKRGYAYNYYMREKNLEERIKINQEVKKDDEEIAAMEAKLNEMKAKRDAKVADDQKKYQEGSQYSEPLLSDSDPSLTGGFHRSM